MDYANVVFHTPLWHVSDITVTFECLANSNYGCSLSRDTHTHTQLHREINWEQQTSVLADRIDILWRNAEIRYLNFKIKFTCVVNIKSSPSGRCRRSVWNVEHRPDQRGVSWR